jgi:glycerate kinase
MPITILIAPSGFKESLGPTEVADAIAAGALRAMPGARILRAPMVDGGEGFTEALVAATGGSLQRLTVTGPVGEPVPAFFGVLGGGQTRTAVIEIAAAAGLRLVPRERRDPTRTTSFGVGELIRAALDAGAERLLVGCGDSGVNDGGVGMAQALGVRFLDDEGRELGPGGGELHRLARIDRAGLDPRILHTPIDVAVNWHNVLLGERGVARVFGPQKGATMEQVALLEAGLEAYARCIEAATGQRIGLQPGSGASGGLGAALMALLGARLHPRFDIITQYLEFETLLREADLVVTAEGSLDGQSALGKVPCEVARRAKRRGIPVIALAGTIGAGARRTFAHGIDAFASILRRPCTLDEAITDARRLLERAAEDALRMVEVGIGLPRRRSTASESAGKAIPRNRPKICGQVSSNLSANCCSTPSPQDPGLVQHATDVLFRDLWLRPDLAPRDRSLVTVSALSASGQAVHVPYYLDRAMDNGLTQDEAAGNAEKALGQPA